MSATEAAAAAFFAQSVAHMLAPPGAEEEAVRCLRAEDLPDLLAHLRERLAQARADGEAAGYRRAIDEACAVLDAQHDEIAGRGTEWAYDDGMLYALDVGEQAVRALAPVEPVSKADELPGGAA